MERKKYTPDEDYKLLKFAKDHGATYPPTGNALWKLAGKKALTSHSWQSMKSRYLLLTTEPASKRPKIARPPKPPASQRRLAFPATSISTTPSPSTSASTSTSFTHRTSASTSTSTSTSTHRTSTLPTRPCPITDSSTQTDETGMTTEGTQTLPQSSHRRSNSF